MAPRGNKSNGGKGVADASASDPGKVAELLERLSLMQGKSLISIAVPAGGDCTRAVEWLACEQGAASAMKSREGKAALLENLASAKERLLSFKETPVTGLLVFCGEAVAGGKSQKLALCFAPFRPIRASLQHVGTSFKTTALQELVDGGDRGPSGKAEPPVLARFMDEATRSTGKACYGIQDTMQALEAAAVESLIVWEHLDLERILARGCKSGKEYHIHSPPAEVGRAPKPLQCPETQEKLERLESVPFLDWIKENTWVYGVTLELITDSSEKGKQFCEGFGGIGAVLRYPMYFEN